MSGRLTEKLLLSEPDLLQSATTDAFLAKAGAGTLSQTQLESWLTQDRMYITCGYVQLIGALLCKIPRTHREPCHLDSIGFSDKLEILTAALVNIERELRFFEQTAVENGLRLDVGPSARCADSEGGDEFLHPATRRYLEFISTVTEPSASFGDAIVLLWGMEVVYLRAWRYAATHRPQTQTRPLPPGMHNALNVLIHNWTSPEFEQFVNTLASLVDQLDVQSHPTANNIWRTTLQCEIEFWQTSTS